MFATYLFRVVAIATGLIILVAMVATCYFESRKSRIAYFELRLSRLAYFESRWSRLAYFESRWSRLVNFESRWSRCAISWSRLKSRSSNRASESSHFGHLKSGCLTVGRNSLKHQLVVLDLVAAYSVAAIVSSFRQALTYSKTSMMPLETLHFPPNHHPYWICSLQSPHSHRSLPLQI